MCPNMLINVFHFSMRTAKRRSADFFYEQEKIVPSKNHIFESEVKQIAKLSGYSNCIAFLLFKQCFKLSEQQNFGPITT